MKRKIAWQSWNQAEEESLSLIKQQESNLNKMLAQSVEIEDGEEFSTRLTLLTPFGEYDTDSFFRPANRWSCWIGHTNFKIGEEDYRILDEEIDGIESLIVIGPYTFCIGIAKLFDSSKVKKDIISRIC